MQPYNRTLAVIIINTKQQQQQQQQQKNKKKDSDGIDYSQQKRENISDLIQETLEAFEIHGRTKQNKQLHPHFILIIIMVFMVPFNNAE